MISIELSVIVPVLNGEDEIGDCLESLLNQEDVELEIVVIDNGSKDKTCEIIKGYPVRLLEENRPGAYAARNCGVLASRGNILGFVDADCVASPRWARVLLDALVQDNLDGVGGAICSHPDDNWIGRHEGQFAHRQELCASGGKFPPYLTGANMMYKRAVFDSIGLFDADLFSGGDNDFGWRASRAGFHLRFVNGAEVSHRGASSLSELYNQNYFYGRGKRSLLKKHNRSVSWIEDLDELFLKFCGLWNGKGDFSDRFLKFLRSGAFFTGLAAGPLS